MASKKAEYAQGIKDELLAKLGAEMLKQFEALPVGADLKLEQFPEVVIDVFKVFALATDEKPDLTT